VTLSADERQKDQKDDDCDCAAGYHFHEPVECVLLNCDVHFAVLVVCHLVALLKNSRARVSLIIMGCHGSTAG